MKSFSTPSKFFTIFVFSGLFLLAGCAWWPFNKSGSNTNFSAGSSDILLTINGKPVLTTQDYEEKLAMARQANPQIDMILSMMPNAEKDLIFRGMTTAELMKAWAQKQGVDQNEAFAKQRKQVHEAMDLQLYMKYFDEAHPIQVSDSDVAKFYEEKKDAIPGLILSQGGIDVSFVRFENKMKAETFFTKTQEFKKAAAFKALAEMEKQQVGAAVINEKSPFAEATKKGILEIKKFPSVKMIKADDNSYWVVLATGKSNTQYRELKTPEVQAGLKKMIADERKEKQLESLIEQLKQELNVVEHTKYFEDKEQQKRETQQAQSENSNDDVAPEHQLPVKV